MTTRVQIDYDLHDRITAPLSKIDNSIEGTNNKLNQAQNPITTFGNNWIDLAKKLALVGASLKMGQYIFDFGKGSIEAASQIESYKTTLINLLGTQDAANKRLVEYQDIAAKTPFELQQVVESGNQLQALGKYSKETLIMLGDLASASGKPIEQAMSAYAKMATGQKGISVDMFRDLMITADDWQKATGKGVSKNGELLASTSELISAIPRIMQQKNFTGMMQSQSKTATGMASNMKDAFFQMEAAIGQRLLPMYKKSTTALTEMFGGIQKLFEFTPAELLDKQMFDVNKMVSEMTDVNTPYERRVELYNQLKTIQPDIIKNYSLEKNNVDALNTSLDEFNKKTVLQIALEKDKEKVQKILNEANKYRDKAAENKSDFNAVFTRMRVNAEQQNDKSALKTLKNIQKNPGIYSQSEMLADFIEKRSTIPMNQLSLASDQNYDPLLKNLDVEWGVGNSRMAFRTTITKLAMLTNDYSKKESKFKKEATDFQNALNDTYSALGLDMSNDNTTVTGTTPGGNLNNNTQLNGGSLPSFDAGSDNGRAKSITINVGKITGIETVTNNQGTNVPEIVEREIIEAVVRGLNSANSM